MFNSISLSKMKKLKIIILIFLPLLISCNLISSKQPSRDYYNIEPANADNKVDDEWASYLYKHLNKRCSQSDAVELSQGDDERKQRFKIIVKEDKALHTDYSVKYGDGCVTLSARDDDQMLWLIYQFMEMLGEEDKRFDISDLSPAIYKYGDDVEGDFAFGYRSIYSPSNEDPEQFPINGVGNIDYDWAIWGHNIHKMLEDEPGDVYAKVDGAVDKDQYCFSSDALYKGVEKYILDNYGEHEKDGKTVRFVIMPNDNDVVCHCSSCISKGNTAMSATPAVTAFIEKLAKRFPEFKFFTSCYLTTKALPDHKLSPNVGVLISTIDLPMVANPEATPKGKEYLNMFNHWRGISGNIYIWDYSRNFDDYLTPYPFLDVAKARLLFYRKYGVKGVVFNGSGNDYASFDDMQTYVLSNLLINPSADVRAAIKRFYHAKYPFSGGVLASYCDTLEQCNMKSGRPLQIYGGIEDAVRGYLQPEVFNDFCVRLDKMSKKITGEERKYLNLLLTGLNFTRLEITRVPGVKQISKEDKIQCLENLKGHASFENMANYREANGVLDDYINYMKANVTYRRDPQNVLLDHPIEKYSELDEESQPVSILTDGHLGIPYDYHTGWLIVSADKFTLQLPTKGNSLESLRVGFLHSPKWRLGVPASIEIWQDGAEIAQVQPQPVVSDVFQRKEVLVNLSKAKRQGGAIEVIISKGKNKIAVDEIELLKE